MISNLLVLLTYFPRAEAKAGGLISIVKFHRCHFLTKKLNLKMDQKRIVDSLTVGVVSGLCILEYVEELRTGIATNDVKRLRTLSSVCFCIVSKKICNPLD